MHKADRSEKVSDWKHKPFYRQKEQTTASSAETSQKNGSTVARQQTRDLVHKSTTVVCYYFKKPGHTLAVCRKCLAKRMNNPPSNEPVQLISTLDQIAADGVSSMPAVGHDQQLEAQLSQSDRTMRLVSSNLANCHATVQKLLIRQVLTKLMV